MGCAGATSVDFGFYRDTYGGGMGVEAFTGALPAAARHVRWICGGHAPSCEADELAFRRAVCAAAEAFAEFGEGQVGGFQLGSFSVTHYDNRGTTGEEQATYACEKELLGTGLLFCGGALMAWLRPIPARLLSDSCLVREPAVDGGFGEPRAISRVRFERAQSVVADVHRGADAGAGTLFVDAAMSAGAFEIPAGSRVEVGGRSYVAAKVARFEGFNGRVHHWEVELR